MAAPLPLGESVFDLGFRFAPTPEEVLGYYLPGLIAGAPMPPVVSPFIHKADVYAYEPGALAAKFPATPKTGDRFFFTTCTLQSGGKSSRAVRATGAGAWHSHGHTANIKNGKGVKIGEVKKLKYKTKGGGVTAWLMDEFCGYSPGSVVGDKQFVLCKIYVSPRAGRDSAARRESEVAVVSPPPQELVPVIVAPPARANNKRPAPPIGEPPCVIKKTRRALVFPSPPVVQMQIPAAPSSVQDLAPHHGPHQQPYLQTSAFCTETPAAQDDDDDDFASELENELERAAVTEVQLPSPLPVQEAAVIVAAPARPNKKPVPPVAAQPPCLVKKTTSRRAAVIPTSPPVQLPSPPPVQAPAPHHSSQPPCLQTSTTFCTETPAAQDDDDFASELENALECDLMESPAAAQDDDNFAILLESFLESDPMERLPF